MKKRADGLFCVQVYTGTGEDGKRKYKSFYGHTKKEAQLKADEFRIKMNKGLKSVGTFSLWASAWIAQKTVGNSQRLNYERAIRKINAVIGDAPINDVRPAALQQLINELYVINPETGKPASKRLLQLIKQTAKQIFRFAILNRAADYNPADGIVIPSGAPVSKRRALTADEIALVTDFQHRARPAVMMMLYAGLRKGELLALTWDDIDLEAGTVTVNKSVEYIGETPRVKAPKTTAGCRVVYVPDVLLSYLHGMQASGLYFPNDRGEMFTLTQFSRLWESYLLDLNAFVTGISKFHPHPDAPAVERFTPHCLRHTFCTLLYEKGVDPVTAQNQLGHADVKTTLSIYTHLSAYHAAEEMKKLNG